MSSFTLHNQIPEASRIKWPIWAAAACCLLEIGCARGHHPDKGHCLLCSSKTSQRWHADTGVTRAFRFLLPESIPVIGKFDHLTCHKGVYLCCRQATFILLDLKRGQLLSYGDDLFRVDLLVLLICIVVRSASKSPPGHTCGLQEFSRGMLASDSFPAPLLCSYSCKAGMNAGVKNLVLRDSTLTSIKMADVKESLYSTLHLFLKIRLYWRHRMTPCGSTGSVRAVACC